MVKYFSKSWSFYRSFYTRGFSTCQVLKKETPIKDEPKVKELLEDAAVMNDHAPLNTEEAWSTSPYPKGTERRNQAMHSLRPIVDPRETSIILFPGQGTQYVGMGKNLIKIPAAKDIFDQANQILKYDIKNLCLTGPKQKLDKTEFAQPAIFVCSIAALERLKEEKPIAIENCVATAGLSLGELTALVFAEAMTFEQALKLVKVRAESMQLASEMEQGAMAFVIYGPDSNLSLACKSAQEFAGSEGIVQPYCQVSNYMYPHCKIVAGHEQAIQFLEKNKKEFKLKVIKRLPVSGAFHTPLMKPAIEPFIAALNKTRIKDPSIAVHSNIDGKIYKNAYHIRKSLPKQILAPVKWEQTLHILYERPQEMAFPNTYECGPGQSMAGILKMVNAKAHDTCFSVPA